MTPIEEQSVQELAGVILKIEPGMWHPVVTDPWAFALDVAQMLTKVMPKLRQSYPGNPEFGYECHKFCRRYLRMAEMWTFDGKLVNICSPRGEVYKWLEEQGMRQPTDGKTLRLNETEAFAFKMRWL